jgi:hypothetical protein
VRLDGSRSVYVAQDYAAENRALRVRVARHHRNAYRRISVSVHNKKQDSEHRTQDSGGKAKARFSSES